MLDSGDKCEPEEGGQGPPLAFEDRGALFINPKHEVYENIMSKLDTLSFAIDKRVVVPTLSMESSKRASEIFSKNAPLGKDRSAARKLYRVYEYDPRYVRALALMTRVGGRCALITRREFVGRGWGASLQLQWDTPLPRCCRRDGGAVVMAGLVSGAATSTQTFIVLDVIQGASHVFEPLQRIQSLYNPAPSPPELDTYMVMGLYPTLYSLPMVMVAVGPLRWDMPPVVFVDDPRGMYGGGLALTRGGDGLTVDRERVRMVKGEGTVVGEVARCTYNPEYEQWTPMGSTFGGFGVANLHDGVHEHLSSVDVDRIEDVGHMVHRHFESAVLTFSWTNEYDCHHQKIKTGL